MLDQETREKYRLEWLAKCKDSLPAITFVPSDGRCYSCRGDLVFEYADSGRYSATGCTLCNRSYCD